MRTFILINLTVFSILSTTLFGQVNKSIGTFPPFTKWYQNPLGFSPLALHTSNGIIIPTIVSGAILLFPKLDTNLTKRLSFYDDFGYSKGYYGSFSNLFHNNLGVNYFIRNHISAGIELTQVNINDNVNHVWGVGIRPYFRFYFINKEKLNLYFLSGAGLIYFFDNYPKPSGFFGDNREGTKLNGCPKYGIGTEIKLISAFHLNLGIWHIHYSNGNNPSFEKNPGHDSNGFSIGITYKGNTK